MSAQHVYEFTHGGKKYKVPSLKAVPMGVIRKTRKITDDLDKAFTILELVIGEDAPELAVIDSMSPDEFGQWMQGWSGQAGPEAVSLGESASS